MPIIKSAIKRARQTTKRRSHNLKVRAAVKLDVRTVLDAVATGDVKATETALRAAQSEIDRAVKKGTLHKNTASRRKSRLVAVVNKTLTPTEADKAAKPKAAGKTTVKKPVAKKAAAKKPLTKATPKK